jgi:hypothetical protein
LKGVELRLRDLALKGKNLRMQNREKPMVLGLHQRKVKKKQKKTTRNLIRKTSSTSQAVRAISEKKKMLRSNRSTKAR